MAQETSLIAGALKAAQAIHEHAASRKWTSKDYHIFMTINTDLFVLRIKVVAKAFDGRSEAQEQQDYDDVMDRIDKSLRHLKVFNYYGLVLTGMNDFGF